jgi:transposase-like protein
VEIYRKVAPKEKKFPGREPKFTTEFMTMVARKVEEEGMTYKEASKTFGISQGGIALWIKKFRAGGKMTVKDQVAPSVELTNYRLEEQVKELKKEIGELYLENLMLKKALYHSQSKKKEGSSVITSENLERWRGGAK